MSGEAFGQGRSLVAAAGKKTGASSVLVWQQFVATAAGLKKIALKVTDRSLGCGQLHGQRQAQGVIGQFVCPEDSLAGSKVGAGGSALFAVSLGAAFGTGQSLHTATGCSRLCVAGCTVAVGTKATSGRCMTKALVMSLLRIDSHELFSTSRLVSERWSSRNIIASGWYNRTVISREE